MSELFLVRHAQASFGTGDYDRLSGLGYRQARWLGEHFRHLSLDFDAVVCGSMLRHRETTDEILAGLGRQGAEAGIDENWNEFDFEAVIRSYVSRFPAEQPGEAATTAQFTRLLRSALLAWSAGTLDGETPEAWPAFETRVRAALAAATRNHGRSVRVLVVSSGGAISMALRQVLEAPAKAMVQMNLQLRNSSISHLYFNDRGLHFSGFNHVPHLERPDRPGAITYY
jgi:broad specificity phosphatase PhoE